MLEQLDMASGQPMKMNKDMTKALNKARSKGWGVHRDNSTKKVKNSEGSVGEKGVILCEGPGDEGLPLDGGEQGLSVRQGQNDVFTKKVEVDGVEEAERYGDSCRGAKNSVWGRWGLTRRKDSNSECSDKNLRGVRDEGNKTPSLRNRDSKSKVNFKSKAKRKNYRVPEIKGTSIKEYFLSRPTQGRGQGGGVQITGAVEN